MLKQRLSLSSACVPALAAVCPLWLALRANSPLHPHSRTNNAPPADTTAPPLQEELEQWAALAQQKEEDALALEKYKRQVGWWLNMQ